MLKPGLKDLFPFDSHATYLNHGGYGVTPYPVTEAMIAKLHGVEENPAYFFKNECRNLWQSVKNKVATRFKLRNEDLALVHNTTDGINAVLRSLPLTIGDEIIVTPMTYGAIDRAVTIFAQTAGAKIVEAPFQFPDPNPDQCLEALKKTITPKTKLVILDHITSSTALIMPMVEMAEVCRRHGVPLLVDGAHVPGHIPLDIPAIGPDWYIANLHKWHFVPRGCGFLWAAPQHHERLLPNVLSWDSAFSYPDNFAWTGTRDPGPWMVIPDAFTFMDQLGVDKVELHNRSLLREAVVMLENMWDVARTTPDFMTGCMTLMPLPAGLPYAPNDEGASKLENDLFHIHRITVPFYCHGGRLWVRIAAQAYNEMKDYEKLAQAILNLQRK